jgi:hypothetical protein
MEKLTEQTVKALLAHNSLEPKEGDLELFGDVLDTYITGLKALHSFDLAGEEVAPTFDPTWKK